MNTECIITINILSPGGPIPQKPGEGFDAPPTL